jgi:hypothetical protein
MSTRSYFVARIRQLYPWQYGGISRELVAYERGLQRDLYFLRSVRARLDIACFRGMGLTYRSSIET